MKKCVKLNEKRRKEKSVPNPISDVRIQHGAGIGTVLKGHQSDVLLEVSETLGVPLCLVLDECGKERLRRRARPKCGILFSSPSSSRPGTQQQHPSGLSMVPRWWLLLSGVNVGANSRGSFPDSVSSVLPHIGRQVPWS